MNDDEALADDKAEIDYSMSLVAELRQLQPELVRAEQEQEAAEKDVKKAKERVADIGRRIRLVVKVMSEPMPPLYKAALTEQRVSAVETRPEPYDLPDGQEWKGTFLSTMFRGPAMTALLDHGLQTMGQLVSWRREGHQLAEIVSGPKAKVMDAAMQEYFTLIKILSPCSKIAKESK